VDYKATLPGHLTYDKGDIIVITDMFPTGWWKGELKKDPTKTGTFNHKDVEEISLNEVFRMK
jgi:hypothetical protein